MALQDPVAVYTAEDNDEAHALVTLLGAAGIESFVTDEETPAPHWVAGYIPDIQTPQVWIERQLIDRAAPLIASYTQQVADRRAAEQATAALAGPITVVCEECGKSAEFPATDKGSVQTCPNCGAYIDVAPDTSVEEWRTAPTDETAEP